MKNLYFVLTFPFLLFITLNSSHINDYSLTSPNDLLDATAANIEVKSTNELPMLSADGSINLVSFSPNGKRVAYPLEINDRYKILIFNLATQNIDNQIKTPIEPDKIKWSKDGNHLKVVQEGYSDFQQITLDIKSGKITELPGDFPEDRLPFNLVKTNGIYPGGSEIKTTHKNCSISTKRDGKTGIFISNKDNSLHRLLVSGFGANAKLSVSPNLRYLIYRQGGEESVSIARLGVGEKISTQFKIVFDETSKPSQKKLTSRLLNKAEQEDYRISGYVYEPSLSPFDSSKVGPNKNVLKGQGVIKKITSEGGIFEMTRIYNVPQSGDVLAEIRYQEESYGGGYTIGDVPFPKLWAELKKYKP